jgi:predicted metal-binding membrane protein
MSTPKDRTTNRAQAKASAVLPLTAQRNAILVLLLVFAASAWGMLAWHATEPGMEMAMATSSPTMGLRAPLFLAIWVTMMVAMMFPTAAPMILAFNKVQADRRNRGRAFVPTWLFVAGYMVVWTLAGLVAYLGALAAEEAAMRSGLSATTAARIGGAILIAAGLYQLTPLKDICLSKCRTPLGFIMTSWRDGMLGALRMGLVHGGWCLGCCWLLFVILFPLGMMNIAAMAAITALIFAEKSMSWGRWAARFVAAVLVIYGATVIANPDALPTFPPDGSAARTVDVGMKMPM